MAKVKCKGTTLSQEIASVYTPIAQLTSINKTGEQSKTYDSTTLDQDDAYETMDGTGYVTPAKIDYEGFFDPNLAGHQALEALVSTPVDTNFEIGYVDGGTTKKKYLCTGFGMDVTVAMNDGLKFKGSLQTSGAPF